MLKVIQGIETQLKTLEDRLKKNSEYVAQVSSTIEKLSADKLNAIKDCDVVNGAIQAYKSVVNELKADTVPELEVVSEIEGS